MAPEITVFYWQGSPWASKVINYLNLRGIPYTECHQPITMPRPILADLGIKYRRIPVVAIGKDIYCDTLLIIQKLETIFPTEGNRVIGAQNNTEKAMEKLLEKWTDAVVFSKAADCIPLDHPLVTDPNFIADRSKLWGYDWDPSERAKKRPEGLVNMREFFDFLENTLLADGRQWILGGNDISVADIHSAWIFNWMLSLPGSFPEDMVSPKIFPKVHAWCERYQKAADEAQKTAKSEVIDGDEALKRLAAADYAEDPKKHSVDDLDPLGLKEGKETVVIPVDTGFTEEEKGPLVAVTREEVVIAVKAKNGAVLHVHTPRWNFRAKPAATVNGH